MNDPVRVIHLDEIDNNLIIVEQTCEGTFLVKLRDSMSWGRGLSAQEAMINLASQLEKMARDLYRESKKY